MSGPDDSDRSFLARWSQRKQEAKQPEPKPDAQAVENAESSGSPEPEGQDVAPQFDLSTLPKLEELTGSTDITAFLRNGVPEHLRNAALRKSWALDPAIRNYVSPALEYAYDWNAPGGVPGGGELDAGVDVARLVSQIMGKPAAETINSDSNSLEDVAVSRSGPSASDLSEESIGRVNETDAPENKAISTADDDNGESMSPEQSPQMGTVAPQQSLRRHGTAKPIVRQKFLRT
ncbi:DUF3306 domain-containing protein [Bradyrhizobium roseum]|uniref:DUF3306 domain-containing protein n=1 Tax=Bradyrhizobium roseum TaxID=3056648 RepID=UPI0026306EAC|nr:DUF3306 domain-containing protein [Bradyrhizobium roseus]WKA31004.1 DUF3306 domain-containing protein [Bradyrhizobium roseus]